MKRNQCKIISFIICIVFCMAEADGQRYFNNPIAQYFRNDYLWNPSFAGQATRPRIYALMNSSWTGFENAPRLINFSGDLAFGNNSGAGLQLISDKSGVLQRNLGAISYSYKVKFSDEEFLRLGTSLELYKERLDNNVINASGDVDPVVKEFNSRGWQFDGDFGLAYQNNNFMLGGAVFNLSSKNFKVATSDLALAQVQTSYKWYFDEENKMSISPLLSYKMYKQHENIFTGAAQFELDKVFHASLYWQSTGNMMGGLGVEIKDWIEANFFYSGKMKYGYNPQYEIGLKVVIMNEE